MCKFLGYFAIFLHEGGLQAHCLTSGGRLVIDQAIQNCFDICASSKGLRDRPPGIEIKRTEEVNCYLEQFFVYWSADTLSAM